MCGIIGAIGCAHAAEILLAGLKRLEYRGYDSAGIATADAAGFAVRRAVGKLSNLASALEAEPLSGETGIGHTRWATHGGVKVENAHPIIADARVAVVHNGIIENHRQLRKELTAKGAVFTSDTDSEVLAHLFAEAIDAGQNLVEATASVLAQIEGAYAFAVMAQDFPHELAIARQASPLAIGLADGAMFVGSDALALGDVSARIIFLKDGDYGVLTQDAVALYDAEGRKTNREIVAISASPGLVSKEGYHHFMEKEIHEQPDVALHSLGAFQDAEGRLQLPWDVDFAAMKGVAYLGAGTSYLAGLVGRYWMESLADLPVAVEIASEFRYRQPAMSQINLALGISQSGESLDTLMALRYAGEKGADTGALVNVASSTMAREAKHVLLTRAGVEVGVASTKSYMAQLVVLLILAVVAGHQRGVIDKKLRREMEVMLASLPRLLGASMACIDAIKPIAKHLARANSCLYLGRGVLYPVALEGALKLKELSYIHAEGYAGGEMKHGPIALIEEGLPVVALLSDDNHFPKMLSNIIEAKARGAEIILIATESAMAKAENEAEEISKMKVIVPDCDPLLAPMVLSLPIQQLAYQTATQKGTDVDQPRNLAKSVTVE